MIVWLIVILAVVLLDQVSKILVVNFLDRSASLDIIKGVFRFTYVENEGAAFGMLSDNRWVFMIISTLAIAGLLVYLWKFRPESKWACVAISFLIGGGIGNMIDRVRLGYVIDFLDFCALPKLWMWVFNVADAFVCVGGGILFVWCVVSLVQETRASVKKKKESCTEASADSETSVQAEQISDGAGSTENTDGIDSTDDKQE